MVNLLLDPSLLIRQAYTLLPTGELAVRDVLGCLRPRHLEYRSAGSDSSFSLSFFASQLQIVNNRRCDRLISIFEQGLRLTGRQQGLV